jgi:hypothetical protein
MKNKIVTCIVLATIAFLISIAGAFAQAKSTFGGDININPFTNGEYGNARVSVAYNGDIYVGRLLHTTTTDYKIWEIQKSTDGGYNFTQFAMNFILEQDVIYTAFDIVACGNNDNEFRLFVARSSRNTITGLSKITLSNYTSAGLATPITLAEAEYTSTNASRGFESISLSTDSKEPSLDASPFSISLAAAKAGLLDSVVLWTDMVGGTMMNRRGLYASPNYIRNVSAATGSAQGSVHGRLGIAWDEYDSSLAEWGNLKVQFVYTDDGLDANFSGPYDVSTQNNLHRKPIIAMSNNNAEQDITGSIILEYNASSTNEGSNIYSRTFDQLILGDPQLESVTVQIGNGDQKDPYVSYNPANNKFLYTYYNAANDALVYETADLSVDIQNLPVTTNLNYRDEQSVITSPMPRIDGRADNQNFFVWNDNGLTYLDAQLHWPASVQNTSVSVADMELYPNPATDNITLSFTAQENDKATLSIIDMTGRILQNIEVNITKGGNKLPIALNNLTIGNYTLRISGEHTNTAVMFTVQH